MDSGFSGLFTGWFARYARGGSKRGVIVDLITKVVSGLWILLLLLSPAQAMDNLEANNPDQKGIDSPERDKSPERVNSPERDKSPVRPESFQRVSHLDASIRLDMRYASDQNFIGRPVAGYLAAACYLAAPAAQALVDVHQSLLAQGYGLVMFDCYRPERATKDFVQWALTKEASQKAQYFPRTEKSELFAKGYIAQHSGHSRGATIDVGLYQLPGDKVAVASGDTAAGVCRRRFDQDRKAGLLDFGSDYDCFDIRSQTAHPGLSNAARQNRQMLVNAMSSQGFVNYDKEWWHFTFEPEPFPTVYFDFPVTQE